MSRKIAENTEKLPKKEILPSYLSPKSKKSSTPESAEPQQVEEKQEPVTRPSAKKESKLGRITGVRLTSEDELKVQELAFRLARSMGGKWNFSMTLRFLIRQADPELNGNWEEIADSVLKDDLKRKKN